MSTLWAKYIISNGARPFLDTLTVHQHPHPLSEVPLLYYLLPMESIIIESITSCFGLSTLGVKMDLAYVSNTGAKFRTTGNYLTTYRWNFSSRADLHWNLAVVYLILTSPFFLTCSSLTLSLHMLYAFSSMDFLKSSITSLLHPSATNEDLETLLKAEDGATSTFVSRYALPTTASRTVKKILIALLPNPIQRRLAPHIYKSPRIHPTSYLDGLRGTCFAGERSFFLSFRVAHSKAPSAGANPCPPQKED